MKTQLDASPISRRQRRFPVLDAGALAVASIATLIVAPAWAWVGLAPLDQRGAPPGFELLILAIAALFTQLISIIEIFVHIRAFGGAVVRGNRENYPVASGLAARLGRAHTNAVANLVPFSAIIVAAQTLGVSNRGTVAGATLFLVARVVHMVSYSTGITVLRSAAFYAGVFAILLVAAQLPWSSIYPHFAPTRVP